MSEGGLRRSGRAGVKMSMDEDLDELSLEDEGIPGMSKARRKKLSKTDKALKNLKYKEDVNSTFMSDFNPNQPRRKVGRKPYASKAKSTIYDDKGCLLDSGLDLCDCLEDDCPGCHFPCRICRSNKCGHECRVNRKWQYDTVEIDGVEGTTKNNKHLVVVQATSK